MKPFLTIQQAGASYPVFVARELLDRAGDLTGARGKVFVITSEALLERFGRRVADSFSPQATIVVMEEGEAVKSIASAHEVVTKLLDGGARRDSTAVVVGGGMIGDTAGFAASIFLRGIDLVHVPTTLLAQVDSSIGGKLAVNHERGKNLIGSFYPPKAVISDTSVLDDLPPRELLSGVFEALKGGVIGDPSLFDLFGQRREAILARQPEVLDELVRKAIEIKARIVSADEKEADLRRLLNYGHTIGHGLETALHYRHLTHGEAVAWGMIAANAIAVRRGILSNAERQRIDDVIRAWNPGAVPHLDPHEILAATEHDKKNTGNARVMIFPRRVGECVVASDVSEEEIAYGIAALGL
ncbi:MAG: 3-dehydroquinate synthase [Thermoanaerobaculia bacterium]